MIQRDIKTKASNFDININKSFWAIQFLFLDIMQALKLSIQVWMVRIPEAGFMRIYSPSTMRVPLAHITVMQRLIIKIRRSPLPTLEVYLKFQIHSSSASDPRCLSVDHPSSTNTVMQDIQDMTVIATLGYC